MWNLFLCVQLTHMDAQQMHPNYITYTQFPPREILSKESSQEIK